MKWSQEGQATVLKLEQIYCDPSWVSYIIKYGETPVL